MPVSPSTGNQTKTSLPERFSGTRQPSDPCEIPHKAPAPESSSKLPNRSEPRPEVFGLGADQLGRVLENAGAAAGCGVACGSMG